MHGETRLLPKELGFCGKEALLRKEYRGLLPLWYWVQKSAELTRVSGWMPDTDVGAEILCFFINLRHINVR